MRLAILLRHLPRMLVWHRKQVQIPMNQKNQRMEEATILPMIPQMKVPQMKALTMVQVSRMLPETVLMIMEMTPPGERMSHPQTNPTEKALTVQTRMQKVPIQKIPMEVQSRFRMPAQTKALTTESRSRMKVEKTLQILLTVRML